MITPEEEIRIKFLDFLIHKVEVPIEFIATEVPIARYVEGEVGRADIIGHFYCNSNKLCYPLFLVECKAPCIPITDKVLEQALKYDKALQVDWIFLTNGIQTEAYQFNSDENRFQCVNSFPTYSEMLSGEMRPVNEALSVYNYVRPQFDAILSIDNLEKATYFNWIGKGSPISNHSYLLNLAGLLYNLKDSMSMPIATPLFEIIEDGYRYTTFGNAAGGGWTGDYRYFVINDSKKQDQVISIGIMGKTHGDDNPKFPNSNGHTILIVAIDDFEKSHNSLQLDLDKFSIKKDNSIEIWHDGTITAGKTGRLKNAIVIDYIKERDDSLIRNGKIFLGELPTDRNITWKDAEGFIINCIKYGLYRDELRKRVAIPVLSAV